MNEYVVLVDDNNRQTGLMEKYSAHSSHTPLHRGFSCYVFNPQGKFLLTQRALSKKVFPGIWTNSCCGHPAQDEMSENAVKRRLKFELGLIPLQLYSLLPNFRYSAEMNGIKENEICPVYAALTESKLAINPEEVENYRWISWTEFVKDIARNPRGYSAWCVEQVAEIKNNHTIQSLAKGIALN